jgi:hypothetical protein
MIHGSRHFDSISIPSITWRLNTTMPQNKRAEPWSSFSVDMACQAYGCFNLINILYFRFLTKQFLFQPSFRKYVNFWLDHDHINLKLMIRVITSFWQVFIYNRLLQMRFYFRFFTRQDIRSILLQKTFNFWFVSDPSYWWGVWIWECIIIFFLFKLI